jgi:hypothetical protein
MSVYSIATQEAARSAGADGSAPPATPTVAPVAPPVAPVAAPAAPPVAGPGAPTVAPEAELGATLSLPSAGAVSAGLGRALDSIGTYIPTEVMATYLAILAVIPAASGNRYQWFMFWAFLAATPIAVWVGVSAAHPGQGLSLPVKAVRKWPWLSMGAATLAFAVFAIGMPGSVVSDVSWYEPWMSTAAIILSAFALSQVNRIAQAIRIRATPG